MPVIGVDRPLAIQFFSRSIREILRTNDLFEIRESQDFLETVPYVSVLLAESAQCGFKNRSLGGFWNFGSIADLCARARGCPHDFYEARSVADQTLLLISFQMKGG